MQAFCFLCLLIGKAFKDSSVLKRYVMAILAKPKFILDLGNSELELHLGLQ